VPCFAIFPEAGTGRILLDVSEPARDFSPEVTTAWEDEIGARLAAVIAGTARSKPIADVFDDLAPRHPARNCGSSMRLLPNLPTPFYATPSSSSS